MQQIYIDDIGKGFPLVLIHGFLGSSRMWGPQIDFFKDFFIFMSLLLIVL